MGVIQVAKFENTHQLEQESHPILQLATASEADNTLVFSSFQILLIMLARC
jgi:hypothetical protein